MASLFTEKVTWLPAAEPIIRHALINQFVQCDLNSDGALVEDEYLRFGGREINRLRREFRTFDDDNNGELSLQEFLTVPVGQPDELRGDIVDPVAQLVEMAWKFMAEHWLDWDLNRDDSLDRTEFETSVIGQYIPGLESTILGDWDLDQNGKVHRDEVRTLLEITYGLRRPEGNKLRTTSGFVLDWQLFRSLKQQSDGFVKRDDYERTVATRNDRINWFQSIHYPRRDGFFFADYATSPHRYDPAEVFLDLDENGDARLSAEEIDNLPAAQFPVANYLIPAFDDDRDGKLSLIEFRLTPTANPLASWHSAVDKNGDGKLSRDEFLFHPQLVLRALGAEYFRRFDIDEDDSLSLDEFTFVTTHPSRHENRINLVIGGSTTSFVLPSFQILRSPEISPTGKHVALSGWEAGENNFASHVLIVDIETEQARDLGAGYLPNWSADGRRLACSRYGEGVLIKTIDAKTDREELVDRQGAGLRFSPDGHSAAYVRRNKIIIHDVNLGLKRTVFGEGESAYRSIEPGLAWSPDSSRLYFLGHRRDGQSEIAVISTTDKRFEARFLCDGQQAFASFSWHPGKARLLFPQQERERQQIQIFEIDPDQPGKPIRFPHQPRHRDVLGMEWSRDGKSFAFVSGR